MNILPFPTTSTVCAACGCSDKWKVTHLGGFFFFERASLLHPFGKRKDIDHHVLRWRCACCGYVFYTECYSSDLNGDA